MSMPVHKSRWFLVALLLGCALILTQNSVSAAEEEEAKPTRENWAHMVIKGSYPEGPQMPGLFGDVTESLSKVVSRLEKAAEDKSLTGVVLHFKGTELGWAKLNELRQAIQKVRKSDKKVFAWIETGMTKDYLIASACDQIVMPESASLILLGLRAEVSFYKNLFDILDIKPDILRVGKYKSAAEPYTRTEMSEAFREEMEALLDNYFGQITGMISASRGLSAEKVEAAINGGPYMAAEAKKLGLIDHIAYEDQLPKLLTGEDSKNEVKLIKKYAKKRADTDFSGIAGLIKLMDLLAGIDSSQRIGSGPRIAVIYATGAIMSGSSAQGSLLGGNVLGSDTFIKAVHKAADDDQVKAIVVRVDSPGGSALASDLMWRALEEAGKPIVVSMGDVAASGGYYISMGAERIFAEPGTLTGSIGVVGGKLAIEGLYKKIGITTSVISRGSNSGTFSPLNGFTESERVAVTGMLNAIYKQFTEKAAAGRKMDYNKLEALARGRVYTGEMALKLGLVDQLGTLDEAIDHARKLGKIKEGEKFEKLILPRPTSPFEQIFGPVDGDTQQHKQISRMLDSLAPGLSEQLKKMDLINLLAREKSLTIMPFEIRVQ
ncbi:signal peptide peptidase SppA [Gimesia maris]|uniref:signal peptide peptidase SppA n=1 Tax=Gimesia maris TaxID=122 RepID=UPI00241DC903|nr:signal peptide peptidase SppA [Gimesia maris]|tara:strand:- start:175868 stop:177679 length:1812 start_codon:yes stop_codon:yes gene_type:complete